MKWKNENLFLKELLNSYINSKRKVFYSFGLPVLLLVFLSWIQWRKHNYQGGFFDAILIEPLAVTPLVMVLIFIYILKPLNNYLSIRQVFIFGEDTIKVEKFFKSYLSFNNDFEFKRSDIKRIFNIHDNGLTLFLDTTTQVTIPFVSGSEKEELLRNFNPDQKIEIKMM